MLKPIVFWGATGQAKVLREFISRRGYQLAALFDNNPSAVSPFPDVPLFIGRDGFRSWRRHFRGEPDFLVAIGGARGRDRLEIQHYLEAEGLKPAMGVHPTAFVAADAVLGKGCQVLAQAAVGTEARLGEACIVNTAAAVDHETRLGNGVHVAPGAILAGCVSVGECSMIGAGAVVLPRLNIGRNVIIGAGAVVTRDIPDNQVAVGNPAQIARENK